MNEWVPPIPCRDCIYYRQPVFGELGSGVMIEPPYCKLNTYLPTRKQSCNRRITQAGSQAKSNKRKCFVCEIEKSMSEFHRNKSDPILGRGYMCIPCRNAYDRIRDKSPDRMAKTKAWLSSENGKKLRRAYAIKNRDEIKVRQLTRKEIRNGDLIRQACAVCGSEHSVAHHPDYGKPFEVIWLCRLHHSEIHRLQPTRATKGGEMMEEFEKELEALINKYSMENGSNTPDWILAQYLISCLLAFNTTIQQRETWYGRDPRPSTRKERDGLERYSDE